MKKLTKITKITKIDGYTEADLEALLDKGIFLQEKVDEIIEVFRKVMPEYGRLKADENNDLSDFEHLAEKFNEWIKDRPFSH